MTNGPGCAASVGRRWLYEGLKRALDVTIAVAVLVALSPLWLVIALVIRITSPGSILYRVHEIGRNGRPFTLYKFRSMYSESDNTIHKRAVADIMGGRPVSVLTEGGSSRAVYKIVDDPRVTAAGRWLRRFSLDELPQFVNVLRGDMSIVGPRPAIDYEYALYDNHQRQRLSVLPGITGLYQVTARSGVPFDKMVEIDLEYITRRSLWLDLKILLKTPWVMLSGTGAH